MRRAVSLNPNDPDGIAMLGFALCLAGDTREGLARANEAARVSPEFEQWLPALGAFAAFIDDRSADGALILDRIGDMPFWGMIWAAAVYADAGRVDDARAMIARHRVDRPLWPIAQQVQQLKRPQDRTRFIAALNAAGYES
jgi:hypothetical protein